MTGLRLHCPFCGRDDIPQYILPTAEHRILSQWIPGPKELCQFLECKPEVGERHVGWWNDSFSCTCAPNKQGIPDCQRFRVKHPKVGEKEA